MTDANQSPSLVLRIPPPVWALVFVLIAYGSNQLIDWTVIAIVRSTPTAIVLIVGGLGLAVWGRLTFAAAGTEVIPASPTNKKLVVDGPFRFTRNPMYAGLLVVTLGISFYAGTLPFFVATMALFFLVNRIFIPFEEEKMERQFGQQFLDYKRRVRRWA